MESNLTQARSKSIATRGAVQGSDSTGTLKLMSWNLNRVSKKACQIAVMSFLDLVHWDVVAVQEGVLGLDRTRRLIMEEGHEWVQGVSHKSRGGLGFIIRYGLKLLQFSWNTPSFSDASLTFVHV